MSLVIVLGYSGSKRTDAVTNLYTGHDVAAARAILEGPPSGISRTEMILNPAPSRRKMHVCGSAGGGLDPETTVSPGAPSEPPGGTPPEPPEEAPVEEPEAAAEEEPQKRLKK
jgi:hypothetical protein